MIVVSGKQLFDLLLSKRSMHAQNNIICMHGVLVRLLTDRIAILFFRLSDRRKQFLVISQKRHKNGFIPVNLACFVACFCAFLVGSECSSICWNGY